MRFALAVAVLVVLGAAACSDIEPGDRADDSTEVVSEPSPSPTPTVEPLTRPRGTPDHTVCQGTLDLPAPGEPRVFPDIYTRVEDAGGIAIVGTGEISDEAFGVAAETIDRVLADRSLRESLGERGAYVVIAEPGQNILELPEFACLAGDAAAGRVAHACGIADRADYPVVSVNELDLLGKIQGPCAGLNILFHELGHLVQGFALSPPDYFDVRYLYQQALSEGRYAGEYASTNANEYFAEATQAYFLHSDLNGNRDHEWLAEYDPALFELISRVYGD